MRLMEVDFLRVVEKSRKIGMKLGSFNSTFSILIPKKDYLDSVMNYNDIHFKF
jgi:hypothetical protein